MTRSRSAFSLILALTVVAQISPLHAGDAVPVLLWSNSVTTNLEKSEVNPFLQTSREEFDVFLEKKFVGQPVVVFVKDNLCVEDFTQHKKGLQEVTNGGSMYYFPAVQQPLDSLKDSMYNQTYSDVDEVWDGLMLYKSISNLDVIPETYNALKESSPNLMAVLTGKSCCYRQSDRVKRETAANNSTAFKVSTKRVLLYAGKAPFIKLSEEQDYIQLPNYLVAEDHGEGTKESPLLLHLQFKLDDKEIPKITLQFKFEVKSAGYYQLKTVNYKKNNEFDNFLNTMNDIAFPFGFSYHCSQKTIFSNGSVVLNITDLQVQIDPKTVNNVRQFSDAYDCVGFTTIPIWTGIFVTAILALIMIWGLTMIMDIRTMDRFDDPKGKTITISAQE